MATYFPIEVTNMFAQIKAGIASVLYKEDIYRYMSGDWRTQRSRPQAKDQLVKKLKYTRTHVCTHTPTSAPVE